MADKEFKLGNAARELMEYTYRATKPIAAEDADKLGFSKSSYRLYGADMRQTAKSIVREIYAANNCDFARDYGTRLANISAGLADCGLLLEFIQLCCNAHIISIKRAGEWTAKATDVRRMAAAWKKADGLRARDLREADAAKANEALAEAFCKALLKMKEQGGN